MIIVNADDFGSSRECNEAIIEAFRQGLISSTTIMANGAAFSEACDLADRFNLGDRIGIHLVLTEGKPVTPDMARFRKFCAPDGSLAFTRNANIILLPGEIRALQTEIAGQVDLCRSRGLTLTHADSHHHVHTELPIFLSAAPVLRRRQIRRLRLSDNVRPAGLARSLYKRLVNKAIKLAGFRHTTYFCDLDGLSRLKNSVDQDDIVIEVMVHPAFGPDGTLIDAGLKLPLAEALEAALASSRKGSYADLS